MNYEQLIAGLETFSSDERQCTVTILCGGEFIPIKGIRVQVGDDVLDDGHPYLKEEENNANN